MLLLPQKKKIATLILGSMKKPKDGRDDFVEYPGEQKESVMHKAESSPEEDSSYAYEQMASEMIAAVASKDAKRLAESLKSFFEMCDMEDDDQGEGEAEDNDEMME